MPRAGGRLAVRVCETPAAVSAAATQAAAGAVVIDVLRATTTMAFAFRAGAREARFYATPTAARRAAHRICRPVVLCGEREGRALPGFDLGNSPAEFTAARVAGRTLLCATTNGSLAFLATRHAARQWAAGFVNLQAVVESVAAWALAEGGRRLLVVCAGKEGAPAAEDSLCAAHFVARLAARLSPRGLALTGAARLPAPAARPESAAAAVRESAHGRYLRALGPEFAADVEACSSWDVVETAPSGRGAKLFPEWPRPR